MVELINGNCCSSHNKDVGVFGPLMVELITDNCCSSHNKDDGVSGPLLMMIDWFGQ